jgi:hypothetical protein
VAPGVSNEETITIRLPAKVRLTYEFEDPYEYPDERQPKLKTEIELYLSKDEAKALHEILLNMIFEATETIYNIRKITKTTQTTQPEPDADVA